MAGDTGCVIEKQLQIPAQISELQNAHARQNELILILRDRLSPILREMQDGESSDKNPRIPLCPVADLIQSEVDTSKAHNNILMDILERLEV